MAGPSLISGLAGSVNAGGTPQGNSGQDLLQIVHAVQQIQEQKKQSSQQDLQTMLELLDKHGIAPDEKIFMQTAKNAGVPIESLTAAVTGNQAVKAGNAGVNKQGAQSAFPVSDSAASKSPGGGVVKTTDPQGTQAALGKTNQFEAMVSRAQERIQNEATTASDRAHLEKLTNQLKLDAGNGDASAVGKLMAMGGMEFKLDQQMWSMASPEERKHMVEIAAGNESPAAKESRLTSSANSLFNTGRYKSLADARSAAEGQQVETLPDLGRMADEAKMYNEIYAATGDSKMAKDVGIKMANGVSLADAIPAGAHPVIQQQLDLAKATSDAQIRGEKDRTELARTGLDLQLKEVDLRMNMLRREMINDANTFTLALDKSKDEALNKDLDNAVNMKRAGYKIDPSFEQNLVNRLAVKTGMVPEKVKGIFDFLGFGPMWGPEYNFKADTSKDQGLIDSATQDSQKPADQLQGLMHKGGSSKVNNDTAAAVQEIAKGVKGMRGGLKMKDFAPRKGEMGR